ncbi:hypothetical protein ACJMK2_035456 [Sinanodonta woodiana]|uniref:AAA+ ATPase domain-containing protein n=1 Tax=Sinanodonta woodiana TaxID=1069815 RepID=A0ABD3WUZ9_SINWO
MDDEFELQYADEIDALGDFEPPEEIISKPRRSLNFTTPNQKSKTDKDDENEGLVPLKSPQEHLNGSTLDIISDAGITGRSVFGQRRDKKRARDDEFTNALEDIEMEFVEDELLPEIVPVSKKAKLSGSIAASKSEILDDIDDDLSSATPEVMKKIVNARQKRNTRHGQLDIIPDVLLTASVDYDFERKRIHRRVPSGDFIAVTGYEGERVYMKLKDEATLEKEYISLKKSIKSSQLLAVPFEELRQQVEDERQQQLMAESERVTSEVRRQLDTDLDIVEGDEREIENEGLEGTGPPVPADEQRSLWVEKYTPRRYTDLLSEENVNRTLLHWLRLWDYVVFGKEISLKTKEKKAVKENKKKKFQPQVLEELDKLNRPLQKIAMLSGPPGLGKTTLAHIVATHAGYNVVEMNASDDRSADVFKNKIEAATQMKAVMGDNPKPNCLIIDEIDGAPQAAINVLLNFVKKTETQAPTKKNKKDGAVLLRPVICICNDQYVPALRQLRQNAVIMNFPPTETTKLAARLYEVIRMEQFKADMNTLLALCEKTDNDIRSCLNTLQFVQRRFKELSLKTIQNLSVGHKDSQKSLFSVWYEIFSLPRVKRNRFLSVRDISDKDLQVNNTSPTARFWNIISVVQSAGEYEKLTQGLFENYLECRFKDPHMEGVCLANEWLCFTDVINQHINHMQDYRLMPYLPYLSVIFHFLFAASVPPKVQYPHAQFEAFTKVSKCQNLVNTMMSDMTPMVRKFLNQSITLLEVLPPLTDIIQPSFRPVNTQLYSAREKEDLAQLIRIMIAYNMTYHQEKTADGQYNYILDPNMEEVVRFPGMKQHRQLTYATKQMIAREIELEKMRRGEASRNRHQESMEEKPENENLKKGPLIPNHRQKLQAKPIMKDEDKPIRDFFGRVIIKTSQDIKDSSKDLPENRNVLKTDIWFHFKEGFSNAVRRNVKVQDFI